MCVGEGEKKGGVPAVVFMADVVAAFAPVVECEANAPETAEHEECVEAFCVEAIQVSEDGEVCDVDGWEDRPESIYLAVIAGDLGEDENDAGDKEREGEGSDEGVGREVPFC